MSASDSDQSIIHEEIDASQVTEDEAERPGDNDPSKRSRGSEIWNYFEKIERESGLESQMAICAVPKCKSKPYSCGKSATTKSLWRHLQNAHWKIYINTEEYKRRKKGKTENGSLEQSWKVRLLLFVIS